MTTTKFILTGLLLAAGLFMQACRESTLYPHRGNGPNNNPSEIKISDVYGVEWELEAFETWNNGSMIDESAVPAGQRYTLTFRQEGLGGENDCNSYGADYALGDNSAITISNIVSTKMYCGIDSRDVEYQGGLENAESYELTSTSLRIRQASGGYDMKFNANISGALRFKRVKAPEIQLLQLELVDLAASDPYTIVSTTLQGDMLRLRVQYSGGCEQHTFNLLGPLTIPSGDPTPITVFLHHESNGDACEALITQDLVFDLTPLRERWKTVTGKSSGTIKLMVNDVHSSEVGPLMYMIGGGGSGNPSWLQDSIAAILSRPVTNPPESFWEYNYNGSTVYFRPQICCDIFSVLYDVAGNVLCHPDGGITGMGDGVCPDFVSKRTNEKLIWEDPR